MHVPQYSRVNVITIYINNEYKPLFFPFKNVYQDANNKVNESF